MDISERKITEIAREVGKFTARTRKADGVGTAEFDLLHVVRKHPGITQPEICRIPGADKGAVAKQTANLEDKGYLQREVNPADGRSQPISPTERAQRLKNSKAQIEAAFYAWLLSSLDETERRAFARPLEVLHRKCKEEGKTGFPHMTRMIESGD